MNESQISIINETSGFDLCMRNPRVFGFIQQVFYATLQIT